MSTRVEGSEWAELTDVPRELWSQRAGGGGPLLCDVEPSHGTMAAFMQTPDHRAIALCRVCRDHIRRVQQKAWGASK